MAAAPAAGPAAAASPGTTTEAYLENVKNLDLAAVKADLAALLSSSQPFWPSDFGYYGGLFIRLAWHCAGSYRTWDGRGGCDGARIRFAPEADWPDNTNLDKARALLAPIKAKYGDNLSWGDLIVLAGNAAIENGGGQTLGVCLGRIDDVDGTASLELGPTTEQELVAPCQVQGACQKPLGPTTLGLIYVNPEGPLAKPIPAQSAPQIRDTFGRMGMNDSETVALVGGGHAFGKAHGACPLGPGLCGTGPEEGKGNNTVTSGFEGPWTNTPTKFSNEYYANLLGNTWVVHTGPGGKNQWKPSSPSAPAIMMLTADVALIKDPQYLALVQQYAGDITTFSNEFQHAWYKLTTRDMGPVTRCVDVAGSLPPAQPWQCPLPDPPASQPDFAAVKEEIKKVMTQAGAADEVNGTSSYGPLFITLAWNSAATYRETDHQGGTNGARIRFAPMSTWPENTGLDQVLTVLQPVKDKFPDLSDADLIVLAGNTALEEGSNVSLPFVGGRVDATEACVTDEFLVAREYQSEMVSIKDDAKVKGLTLPHYVALMGMPRSPSHQEALNYSGSWANSTDPLSNAYFIIITTETWVNSTSAAGQLEYKTATNDSYITPMDYALTQDPELLAIAKGFAANEAAFQTAFTDAWTSMMTAEVPSASNSSSSTPPPPGGKAAAPGAASSWATGIIAALSSLLLFAVL